MQGVVGAAHNKVVMVVEAKHHIIHVGEWWWISLTVINSLFQQRFFCCLEQTDCQKKISLHLSYSGGGGHIKEKVTRWELSPPFWFLFMYDYAVVPCHLWYSLAPLCCCCTNFSNMLSGSLPEDAANNATNTRLLLIAAFVVEHTKFSPDIHTHTLSLSQIL